MFLFPHKALRFSGYLLRGEEPHNATYQDDEQQYALAYTHRPHTEGFTHPVPAPCAPFVSPLPSAYHRNEPKQYDDTGYQIAVAGILGYPFKMFIYQFVHCSFYWADNVWQRSALFSRFAVVSSLFSK